MKATPEELKPCPFCGGLPQITTRGNDYTKKRLVEIECTNKLCRTMQVTGAIHNNLEWCTDIAISKWNKRFDLNEVIRDELIRYEMYWNFVIRENAEITVDEYLKSREK